MTTKKLRKTHTTEFKQEAVFLAAKIINNANKQNSHPRSHNF